MVATVCINYLDNSFTVSLIAKSSRATMEDPEDDVPQMVVADVGEQKSKLTSDFELPFPGAKELT